MLARFLVAWSFVIGACAAGCAALAGINDGKDGTSSSGEADLPVRDAADGGGSEADTGAPGACKPGNAEDSPSLIHASKVTVEAPVSVNGDPAEWACVDRLDFSVGGRVIGPAAGKDIAEIAMQWDEGHLYLLARVTTDSPGGVATGNQIFSNDSVQLFLAGPDPQVGVLARLSDHQIVFDYQGFVVDYRGGIARAGTNGITSAISPFNSQNGVLTFVVEAAIDAAIVGRPGGFTKGERVRVNFQVNESAPSGYRVWFWAPEVCVGFTGCNTGGVSLPYCDPRCTGEVELR